MYLEIITPENTLFKGEVTSISAPGLGGEFEILNNHAPIVSLLKKGNIKIIGNIILDETVEAKFIKHPKSTWLPITSGTLEMNENKVIVLAD